MRKATWSFFLSRVAAVYAVASAVAACQPSDVSRVREPSAAASREPIAAASMDEGDPCTPEMIFCENPPEDDYEEFYFEYADGSAVEQAAVEGYSGGPAAYGPISCIPSFTAVSFPLVVPVPNPNGGFPVNKPVSFAGVWILETWVGAVGASVADYHFPSGYFPALDGSGVEVQVGSGRASCSWAPLDKYTVAFFQYRQVNGRWPRARPASNGGGGYQDPSIAAPDGCYWDYTYLEVDYHDGTGWHVLWEGWALWCGF